MKLVVNILIQFSFSLFYFSAIVEMPLANLGE